MSGKHNNLLSPAQRLVLERLDSGDRLTVDHDRVTWMSDSTTVRKTTVAFLEANGLIRHDGPTRTIVATLASRDALQDKLIVRTRSWSSPLADDTNQFLEQLAELLRADNGHRELLKSIDYRIGASWAIFRDQPSVSLCLIHQEMLDQPIALHGVFSAIVQVDVWGTRTKSSRGLLFDLFDFVSSTLEAMHGPLNSYPCCLLRIANGQDVIDYARRDRIRSDWRILAANKPIATDDMRAISEPWELSAIKELLRQLSAQWECEPKADDDPFGLLGDTPWGQRDQSDRKS